MGQKIRPTGFRTGIMIGWASQWFANKNDFSDLLVEDHKIRTFILKLLKKKRPQISKIRIDRTREKVIVTIASAKIGVIIGKKGADIDKLTALLQNLTRRVIEVKTVEVARPETDPQTVAQEIAEQLAKRASFRRTLKQAMEKPMEAGAKGIRTLLSGRPGGSEMARCEKSARGRSRDDAAGEGRVRVHRGLDGPGEHRDQGVGEQRRLPDRGVARHARPRPRPGPAAGVGRAATAMVGAAGSAESGLSDYV